MKYFKIICSSLIVVLSILNYLRVIYFFKETLILLIIYTSIVIYFEYFKENNISSYSTIFGSYYNSTKFIFCSCRNQ